MTYFFGVYYKNKHQNLTTPALSYLQQWASNGNITTALKTISIKGFSAAVNSTDESYQLNKDEKTFVLGELSRQYFDKLSPSACSDIEDFYKRISNALLSNHSHKAF